MKFQKYNFETDLERSLVKKRMKGYVNVLLDVDREKFVNLILENLARLDGIIGEK